MIAKTIGLKDARQFMRLSCAAFGALCQQVDP